MVLQKSQLYETLDQFNPNLLFLLLILSLFALYIKLTKGQKKHNLPPSPSKLPIIGNLHQLSRLPHQSITSLSKKYGPLMLLKMGQSQVVTVSSPELAREVLKTHDAAFSNRPQTTAAKIFGYNGKSLGLSQYGDYWRSIKRISVHKLLRAKRQELFQYVREDEVQVLLKRLHDAFHGGVSVNLTDLLVTASSNVISRCISGKEVDGGNEKSKYGELARVIQKQLLAFCFADSFPSLSWIDNVRGFVRKLQNIHQDFDAVFDQMIEEHKVKSVSNQSGHGQKDFTDILLQLQKDGDLDFELTDETIKAILTDFYLAGGDTTATTLEWTMAELIKNPVKMRKVQEEIRGILGNKTKIDQNDVNQMHYLDCVIKESIRLHPSGPSLIIRRTTTLIKDIGGYEIPANTRVLVNIYGIQRDPSAWENPNEFTPERFIDNLIDFKSQHTFQYIPFGGGRRICPGIAFAITSVKYFLAHLLYLFDWKLADESLIPEELDMEETSGIAVIKKNPLHLKPILYCP